MKKLKDLKLGSYFRELSIVIIGVTVTLFAGNVISHISEKKEARTQLNNVYSELEGNLLRVGQLMDYYEKRQQLSDFLWDYHKHPEKKLDDETYSRYNAILNEKYSFNYRKGAYDSFITGGGMKLLKNKTFLLDIAECYEMMEEIKSGHDQLMELRLNQFSRLYDNDINFIVKSHKISDPRVRGVFNFYMLTGEDRSDIRNLKEHIERVLSRAVSENK